MSTQPAFSFDDVGKASFSTSAAADEINTEFANDRLGLRGRNFAARMALARSLSVTEAPEPAEDGNGKVIKGVNLFGEDSRTWVALLLEHAGADDATVSDLQELVRRHWARGMRLLDDDWKSCDGDFDRFIVRLASQAGLRGSGAIASGPTAAAGGFKAKAVPVRVPIGDESTDVESRERVEWLLNGKGNSPHMAIMGTLGTGKTRTAMTMLRAIRKQSGCPVLLFDMGKGDLAADRELAAELGAEVIEPTRKPIPLDILYSASTERTDLAAVAMRFRESFARVPPNRIGGAQADLLRDAVLRALLGNRPVKLADIFERLKEVYAEQKRRNDIVVSTFKDMTTWTLFDPAMPPEVFFSRSWIIDLHGAPETAQRLVVFLLLDALQTYLTLLPDSGLDDQGNRAMRIVVAIDEARKVLGFEQPSLIGLVRESRSKGGAVMFISQSPDDFDGEDENFLENIGLGVCFRTNARSGALAALLGQSIDLGSLQNGVAATRLVERGLVRIQAWNPT